MMRPRSRADVLIIGAGLAGATTAAALAARGLKVIVIEARDRPGGRAFTRQYAHTGESLEFGGAWITPWQQRMRALCLRHGLALRPRHPITARRWLYGDAVHADGPVPAAEQSGHRRVLERMAEHAARLKSGQVSDIRGRGLDELDFNSYLELLDAPPGTRELLSAWWTVSGSGEKARVPVTELLQSVAHGDGTPDGICAAWTDTVAEGAQTLVARMLAGSGATCHFDNRALRIRQDGAGVRVDTHAGQFAAAAAVVATGINPMGAIAFDPPLPSPRAATLATGHLGRAVKVWARVAGVPVGVLATGGRRGIEWLFAERRCADGTTFVVGFGVAADGWTPEMPTDALRAVERAFPEGRCIDCDWHDWNADPCSRGTWVSGVLGAPMAFAAESWNRLGRIAFASSDFATADAGWFEGAIVSGENAALDVHVILGAH